MKLIIGNKNYSSWSMRPWLLLKHFQVEFEEIRIPLFTEGFEKQLALYTEANKVPVLHDGQTRVWDSLAICEYVNEQYLEGQGWPQDKALRAEARSASAEMHSSFMAVREFMPLNCRAQRRIAFNDEMLAEIQRIDSLWLDLRLKHQGQGPWLFGEFSIADCMYAPMASRFRTYAPDISAQSSQYVESILAHDAVRLWYQQAAAEQEVLEHYHVGEAI